MITEAHIAAVIASILRHEGGYVNNPDDRGGETNFGITQSTANEYGFGPVRQLNLALATQAYRTMFGKWQIDQVPDASTFGLVADCCVNHGQGWGIRWLQTAINATADGSIGPKTRTALAAVQEWEPVYAEIVALRARFYGHLIANNHPQAQFAGGWLDRLASFIFPWPKWT